ncbi:SurA N-terminal domain-containing protein [Sphingomonas sp. MMS24-JH45]
MFSFIRRLINSRVGVLITFGVLAVIALAFAAGGVTGLAGNTGILGGENVATVGNKGVSSTDLRRRVQDELRSARQQQPEIDMAALVNAGAVEGLLDRLVTGIALQAFGEANGMRVSRALVGSELKNIPASAGRRGSSTSRRIERIITSRA